MRVIGKAPRGALFTVVVVALGCLLAACGSAGSASSASSSNSTGTTTASAATGGAGGGPGGGGANPARRAALVACLKQHGVTLPARPPGAGGGAPGGGTGTTGTNGTGTTPRRGFFGGGGGFAANPKLRAAFQACGARFGFGGGGRFRGTLARANVTKYVTCVRQHGYNLPNPNFSGKGPVFPSNIRSNAKFQAASRACQSLLVPPRPSGSGSGAGSSTTSGA